MKQLFKNNILSNGCKRLFKQVHNYGKPSLM